MTKIVLWGSDLDAQSAFYTSLLNLSVGHKAPGFVELTSHQNSVLLHELPVEYRSAVPLTKQLMVQEEVAIKPIFLVDDLDRAREAVQGSFASFPREELAHGKSRFIDVVDPEGNVIQLEQNPL